MSVIPDSINVLLAILMPVHHAWLDSTFLMELVQLAIQNTRIAKNVTQLIVHYVSTITSSKIIPATFVLPDSQVVICVILLNVSLVILVTF